MAIHLSSSPPSSSSSFSLIRLNNTKSPISNFPLKLKTHFSKSHFSSIFYSIPLSSSSSSSPNPHFFHAKNKSRSSHRTCALAGFDFLGGFESAQSVVQAAGVLTAIIVVHESGHFLAAYLQGIHVSKFAIGFGPILAKFNSKSVEYSIRAIPFGGFVGFPDNDPDSDIPIDDKNLLKNRPMFDRILVISAGVIANIMFAYLIIFVQVVSVGLPVQEASPGVLVQEVRAFSAASRDGLLPGDVVLAANGFELPISGPKSVTELVDIIKQNPKRNVLLKVKREGEDFEIGITPEEFSDGTGRIGVQLSPNVKISKIKPTNIPDTFKFAGKEFWGLTFNVLDSLKQTFLNFSQTASKVSGPVAIIAVGAEVARSNTDGLFQFAALLNINLAVINLLPIPALDGCSLAFIMIEAARGGQKLPLEIEQRIMSSGIMLVLILGLFLIVRDTLNLDFIKDLL